MNNYNVVRVDSTTDTLIPADEKIYYPMIFCLKNNNYTNENRHKKNLRYFYLVNERLPHNNELLKLTYKYENNNFILSDFKKDRYLYDCKALYNSSFSNPLRYPTNQSEQKKWLPHLIFNIYSILKQLMAKTGSIFYKEELSKYNEYDVIYDINVDINEYKLILIFTRHYIPNVTPIDFNKYLYTNMWDLTGNLHTSTPPRLLTVNELIKIDNEVAVNNKGKSNLISSYPTHNKPSDDNAKNFKIGCITKTYNSTDYSNSSLIAAGYKGDIINKVIIYKREKKDGYSLLYITEIIDSKISYYKLNKYEDKQQYNKQLKKESNIHNFFKFISKKGVKTDMTIDEFNELAKKSPAEIDQKLQDLAERFLIK